MLRNVLLAVLLMSAAPLAAQEGPADAAITIDQVQVSLLIGGAAGGGVLTFKGKDYPFSLGGVGVGGIGVSRLSAEGEVWGLDAPGDIEGAYAQLRAGAVAGDQATDSWLWIENGSGVRIRLRSRREGVALSVGGDAIVIRLD